MQLAVPPSHRYAALVKRAEAEDAEPPSDPLDLALFRVLKGQRDNAVVSTAYDIFRSPYRHVMDALCLCSAKDAEVEKCLELRPGVYAVYQTLFFDRAVFTSVFAMRHYVETLHLTREERDVYEVALVEGAGRLLDRYRMTERPPLEPQVVLEDMMGEAYSRAFEHRGKPLTSKTAEAAFRWGRAAAATAATIKTTAQGTRVADALSALEFALTTKKSTATAEELGVNRDDILKG